MSNWSINKRQIGPKDWQLGESPTEGQSVQNKRDGGWVEKVKGIYVVGNRAIVSKAKPAEKNEYRRGPDIYYLRNLLYLWSYFCDVFAYSNWVVDERQ